MELIFTDDADRLRLTALRNNIDAVLKRLANADEETPLVDALREAASVAEPGILLTFSEDEARLLGEDSPLISGWISTVMLALVLLRQTEGRLKLPAATWSRLLRDLDCELIPRLEGIRDALLRASAAPLAVTDGRGEMGAASLGETADWTGVSKSTAKSRRAAIENRQPSPWEEWARGGTQAPGRPRCPYCGRQDITVTAGRWECPPCQASGPVSALEHGQPHRDDDEEAANREP